jgi:hypothetical protein
MSSKKKRNQIQTARQPRPMQPVRPVRKAVAGPPAWIGPAAVAAFVAVVIGAFLLYRWYSTPLPLPSPSPDSEAALIQSITTLPASQFETTGQGSANNLIKPASGTVLTGASGKPQVLYVGGEFCPFCAAQRWALIIALSRFGTFKGLSATASSDAIEFPNTPTFTFRNAKYTSQYIDFRGVETSDRDQQPLMTLTTAEDQTFGKYNPGRTIPFIDFGNKYTSVGAMYSPDVLAGQSWQAVVDELKDPTSNQSRAIIGSANLITAAICKMTSDQPSTVCTPMIQDLQKKLT